MTEATLLIIDDDEDILTLLDLDLNERGFEVVTCKSGEEALELVHAMTPDLVLLDLSLRGMSGIDTLLQLKSNLQLRHVPVVVLSASHDDDKIINALEKGASDYVTKPCRFEVLVARIRNALRTKRQREELISVNAALHRLATTDELTALRNRRHFFEVASTEFARAKRHDQVFSVMMIDVDFFKDVNDRYGHGVGDEVLKMVAEIAKREFRQEDLIARIGGEEFCVCMPCTTVEEARIPADRFRKSVCQFLISAEAGVLAANGLSVGDNAASLSENSAKSSGNFWVSVSIGITEYNVKDQNIDHLLLRADRALYDAKSAGRNCIRLC